MTKAVPQTIPQNISEQIRIARVICIFFMIYAHVNPGAGEFLPAAEGIRLFDAMRFWLADGAARASAGLLSIVAGYLALVSFQRTPFGKLIARRTRSLVIPMTLWSLAVIALAALGDLVRPGYWQQTVGHLDLMSLPNLLFGITAPPANLPLSFLRDLFACALLTPPLIWLLRRAALPVLAVLFVFSVTHAPILVIYTPSILFLYALGLTIAMRGVEGVKVGPRLFMVSLIAFMAIGGWLAWAEMHRALTPDAGWTLFIEPAFNVLRIPAAIVFWKFSEWLMQGRLRGAVESLEPYVFTAFCSHLVVTTLVWAVWQPALGGYYGLAYPVFFFTAPVLCFAASFVIVHATSFASPAVFRAINGGRSAPVGPIPQRRANGAKASATAS